jgi:hypothetical protein
MKFPEKPLDLLFAVYNGTISGDEAENLMIEATRRWHKGLLLCHEPEYFGISKKEYTASCHAASLASVAKWRYDGWPTECFICKKPLDSDKYCWGVVEDDKGNDHLAHVGCMPTYECDEDEEDIKFDDEEEDEFSSKTEDE